MKTIVTNKKLYNEYVESVNLNNVKFSTEKTFYANVEIEYIDGTKREIFGEFGYADYKKELGFIFSK